MKSKVNLFGIFLFSILVFSSYAQQDDFPVLKGPYLGQKPPGLTPQLFAPGIISKPSNRTGDYDVWWVSTKIMEVLNSSPLSYKILSENGRIIIPFEFHRNKFRFNATINGRSCNMMLDNGSLWDQLLFFGSPRVDSIGFKITGETSIGKTKADTATDITVRFKDVVFYDQAAVITRYDPKLPNPWEGFDGQISAAFFKHFVVRIDFDKTVIELIPFGKFTYSGKVQALPMQPGPFDSRMITADIITRNGETVTLDMLIDLGGGFTPSIFPLAGMIESRFLLTLSRQHLEKGCLFRKVIWEPLTVFVWADIS